jgi:hypothetical protein
MAASKVWCRGSEVRAPPISSRNRSPGLQRAQRRKRLPQLGMAQLDHPLGGGQVLQPMHAKLAKVGLLGKVVPHQLRHGG